jgi:hypothetical protein
MRPPIKENPMFEETTETAEETTESCVPTLKQVATCMVLGASAYVFASKALLYYRLRKAVREDIKEAQMYHQQETKKES